MSETNNEWTTKWPTRVGTYWFYSYRYGKISCGRPQEPELMLAELMLISNGTMLKADGQIVFESEPEEAHFMKVDLPAFPKI